MQGLVLLLPVEEQREWQVQVYRSEDEQEESAQRCPRAEEPDGEDGEVIKMMIMNG